MAWQDETVPMLRAVLGDWGSTPEYSDSRLLQVLIVAARFIDQDINFDDDRTINVVACTITIAPDEIFINFMVLKAACMIDVGAARVAAMTAGLKAKCGPAIMETLRRMEGFGTLLDKGACETYKQAKKEYQFGNVTWCKGILSPFINGNFFPTDYSNYGYENDLRINNR